MYCSSNDQVKSSMLLGQRRRRPICRMLKVDILGPQDRRESLSAIDGALRCCGSAGTVQTSMAVPCCVDTCRPWRRVWTWNAQGRQANVRMLVSPRSNCSMVTAAYAMNDIQIRKAVESSKTEGKVPPTALESGGGCLSGLDRADRWRPTFCDAWPVRCQTYGCLPSRKASPPVG